ncbi:fibronectin type III domain-containing protein [Flavobacterium sp. GT3P67]|uniref:fibronectin type III domain-containing protein n=1 Tax=Flavobacterium sp. GT3P67 TaxID=2541722 RepID=UPI0014051EDD|nr:fibronectin type III domain-containing protein [Flavobacterium sp. GT3P67]
MKKITCLAFLFFLLFCQFSIAQSINNWQIKEESKISKTISKPDKKIIPSKYKIFSLDFKSLKTNLSFASKRSQNNKLTTTLLLDFPLENGTTESFSVEKVSTLHPDLEAKYPDIQSFYGVSRKNPLNKIYISMSPEGFTGLITGEKTIYIDPFAKNDTKNYIVYDRKDCTKNLTDGFVCNTVMDEQLTSSISSGAKGAKINNSTDGKLRTYRLAVACTSEYTTYCGNTVAGALAAINTTITRVNSVYKRDFAVVFQLVANNDRLIYRNNVNIDAIPDADPYDNYDGSQMLGTNTSNITGLIGVGNYDIGHVFSTGGGGIASTGPCMAASKGSGVTGIVTPQFDPFDIDYVCHEIGHQFGAGHTQNNNCQRASTSAMEPGSASTIMGYAGICAPNVQGNSDAYFHAISIQQMTAAIATHTCETETVTANNEPVLAAIANYTIPKSTPFTLTGNATDAENNPMTYTWEQMNNETTGVMPPVSTNPGSPNFRSFSPTTSPSRTFPNLNAIIDNITPTWEVLPSIARILNFRLTVRDNNPLGGQTKQGNSVVTVSGTAGPFLVTAPNTGSEIWYAGETKTITWNVASTNTATFSTTVNIKLSTDGGYTYPIVLASGVANSGSQNITVPNNVGKLNRIKVEAATNIFFDLSNANFEIKSGKFEIITAQSGVSVCKPTSAVYTLNYTPAPGFNEIVTFSAIGLPTGATASFSPTTRTNTGSVTMTVSSIDSVSAENYSFNFNGTSTSANINFPVELNVFDNTIGNVMLTGPSNGASNQQTSSLLQWQALSNASSYLVQISTNPNFSTITESATVTSNSYQTSALTQGTINYWRVKPINPCVSGVFSEVYVFQIASDFCKTYANVYFENNDSTWETNSTNAVSARIDIPDNIIISDVNFYMKATHPLLSDIKMQFSGPTGIFAEIYNRDCNGANIDVTFDDSGAPLPVPCLTTLSGVKQSSQALSKFNGSSSLGTWVLLATDRVANTSGGTFNQFNISICGKLQIVNNITLTYNPVSVGQGTTTTILQSKLSASQPGATTSQLIYTITQLPARGTLKLNGTVLNNGDVFSQADINNGLLSYINDGINSNSDSFKFSIKGNNSAILGGQTFAVNICGAPIPVVANLTIVTGQCSTTATAPTASSACAGVITGTTATTFPITSQGTTIVTWTYNDGNGNTSTQNQTIIIDDTIAPLVPTLASVSSQNPVTLVAPTTTDNCTGTITGMTNTVFPIIDSGTTVVTWTFDDGNGQSVTAFQNVLIDSSAPTVPTLLVASGTTQTSTLLSWNASIDDVAVTGYDVYQDTALIATVASTSFTVTGLTTSSPYAFSVKAKDAFGNISGASDEVIITTLDPIIDVTAPTSPTSLAASGTTQSSTNLSWVASTDDVGVTGYDVYQGITLLTTVSTTSYEVTGLSTAAAYTFTVKAKDAAGNVSATSNVVDVTTPDTTAPTVTTDLTASGTTSTTTNLSWTASTDNVTVTGYDVYQGVTLLATVSTTSYVVTGLNTAATYTFTVKAKDAAGNVSAASNIVNVTTPDTTAPTVPTSLTVSGTTSTTTNLSWTASTDNVAVTGYDVYKGVTLQGTTSGTTYSVTGLTASTAYTFTVKAKDVAGNVSPSSNIVNVTTLANTLIYCTSQGNSVASEKIGKVVLGTISNTSTGGTGYENFTAISTNTSRGTAYTITITPSWTSTKYKEGYAVWIDYNRDGDFADAGELVWSKTASTTTPVSGSFTIPATAVIGSTRMRVSMKYNAIPTSCEVFSFGQVEDYTVNIVSSTAKLIESIKVQNINIYPNPVKGAVLNVSSAENATYRVINLLGQEVSKGKVENGAVSVTNINTGAYLLEITTNGQSVIKRFIKQ